MITADNYGTGYSGTASRGMGAEAIRKKMESINPDKFKIRKFGVSDVIGLTAAGKTSFFYVDKDRLVRFNGFFPKPQSGTYLILDEGGYQVAGQKGTWLVSDEVEVDGQRFVQMRSEQTKNPPPSIILHESGAFVTQTALGFDGEATRKMSAFLQGQKPELLHHQKFFENGTAERAKESGTEQNYNMNAFQAPYKAVLISLYESAVKNGNTAIAEEVKENFDVQVEDIAQRFRDLGLDDSLVRPSYVVNVSPLQEKINKTIRNEPEVEYHKDNEAFLKTVLSEFKMLTGEADA